MQSLVEVFGCDGCGGTCPRSVTRAREHVSGTDEAVKGVSVRRPSVAAVELRDKFFTNPQQTLDIWSESG